MCSIISAATSQRDITPDDVQPAMIPMVSGLENPVLLSLTAEAAVVPVVERNDGRLAEEDVYNTPDNDEVNEIDNRVIEEQSSIDNGPLATADSMSTDLHAQASSKMLTATGYFGKLLFDFGVDTVSLSSSVTRCRSANIPTSYGNASLHKPPISNPLHARAWTQDSALPQLKRVRELCLATAGPPPKKVKAVVPQPDKARKPPPAALNSSSEKLKCFGLDVSHTPVYSIALFHPRSK